MRPVRVAIVGVGNCASSLVQGVAHIRRFGPDGSGVMRHVIGGRGPADVEFVAAFDIDARKVGRPLNEAVFSLPNCVATMEALPRADTPQVQMGRVLDGVAAHMTTDPEGGRDSFVVAHAKPVNVAHVLKLARADVLVNYLPVGSERAALFYAEEAARAGCALVNCMPVFLTRNAALMARFKRRGLPVVGDDIKSQVGATIVHRTLARLFEMRGYRVTRTYQLNVGGNTDFRNMLERSRLTSKKRSKTQSVVAQIPMSNLPPRALHIGPSDFVPFLGDNKIAFMRLEGTGFCGAPIELEVRLSVQDSPNSAGVVLDAVRYAMRAKDKKQGGVLLVASAACMKSPPELNDRSDFDLMARLP